MVLTDDDRDQMLIEIHTMMMGSNGQGGCYRSHSQLKNDFYRFRLCVIVGAVILTTGGGFGSWKIFNLLMQLIK